MNPTDMFVTFRHFVRQDVVDATDSKGKAIKKPIKFHGAVTAAVVVAPPMMEDKPEDRRLLIGFSFCSPDDMFDRAFGRDQAVGRLIVNGINVKADADIAKVCIHLLKTLEPGELGASKHVNGSYENFAKWYAKYKKLL